MPVKQPIRVRYLVTALLLGVVWFVGLLAAPSTAGFLSVPEWWNFKLQWYELLPIMCVSSLVLALAFRRWIVKKQSLLRRLLLGTLLPFAGATIFIWLTILYACSTGRVESTSNMYPPAVELAALMFFTALYGLLYALWAFYVVIPIGLVSQLLMERTGRGEHETSHAI